MIKVAEHSFNRIKISIYSIGVGLLIGLYNSFFPPIDFTFTPEFYLLIFVSLIFVVILHESIHGATAVIFGHKPIFGLKVPLVYVTFTEKIRRGPFITIALAPLVIINVIFVIFFTIGLLKDFSYLCLIINTLGSVGDIWMTQKLLTHEKGVLVQDTKTGIEVWRVNTSEGE